MRISLVSPKDGQHDEVVRIENQLVEFFRSQPGFVAGYKLTSANHVGRVTVWDSVENADRVAMSQHVLSVRSQLLPLIGDSIEYGLQAESVAAG